MGMHKNENLHRSKFILMIAILSVSWTFNYLEAKEKNRNRANCIEMARKIEKIEQISDLGNKTSVDSIVLYLNDSEPRIRRIAAEKIGYLGDEKAIAYLNKNDSCWFVRNTLRHSSEMINMRKKLNLPSVEKLNKEKQMLFKTAMENSEYTKIIVELFIKKGWIEESEEIIKKDPKLQNILGFDIQRARAKHLLDVMPKSQRIKAAIDLLINWKTVPEYEGAILVLIETGNDVIPTVLKLLNGASNIPNSSPPPWGKVHTNYSIVLKVLKSIPDKRSLQVLEKMSNNKIEFISKEAKDALEWVKSGIPYPFKYERTLLMSTDEIPPEEK